MCRLVLRAVHCWLHAYHIYHICQIRSACASLRTTTCQASCAWTGLPCLRDLVLDNVTHDMSQETHRHDYVLQGRAG